MKRWKSGQTSATIYNKSKVQFTLAQSDEQFLLLSKTQMHIIMTQLNIKDGHKAYGNKQYKTVLKDHTTSTYAMQQERKSYEERRNALRYLMFLKEKQEGQ